MLSADMAETMQIQQIIKDGMSYEAENKMEKYDYSHSNAGNRILGIFYLPTVTFWHTNGNYDHASAVCYQLNYRIRT